MRLRIILLATSGLVLGTAAVAQTTAAEAPSNEAPSNEAPSNNDAATPKHESATPEQNAAALAASAPGEIIVTARKRAERLQEVPISVNVTSGETLVRLDQRNLESLSNYVPNLYIQSSPANNAIYIRGIGSAPANLGFEQSVGLFVDGVYAGRGRQFSVPFMDIARVEVLRGGQGALFGKNTSAGAINISTNTPTDDTLFITNVAGTVDGDNGIELTQIASGRLSDKFAGRIVAQYSNNQGWLDNTATGEHNPSRESLAGRATIDFTPDDTLLVRLKIEAGSLDMTGQPMTTVAGGGKPTFTRATTPGVPDYDNSNNASGTLLIAKDIGAVTVTSISAYSWFKYDKQIDSDFTAAPLLKSVFQEDFNQFSQELRLASQAGSAFDYIVGGYFHHNEIDMTQATTITFGPFNGQSNRHFIQQDDSFSLYAQGSYLFGEHVKVTAGLRQTWETKNANQWRSKTGVVPPTWLATPLSDDLSESQFDPSAQIQYIINRNAMFYASYAHGSKAGGFVAAQSTTTATQFQFAGETSNAFEIGGKFTFMEGRGMFNIAAFLSDFDDLQVSTWDATTNTFITNNAATARTQGVEIESSFQILPVLRIAGALGYDDAHYTDYPGAPCVFSPTNNPPAATCTENIAGTRLPRAPEWSGNITISLNQPIGSVRLLGDATLTGRSGTYLEENLRPSSYQPGYGKVDLRLGIAALDNRWSVALLGKNVGNTLTASHAFGTPFIAGSETYVIDPGRVITIQANLQF